MTEAKLVLQDISVRISAGSEVKTLLNNINLTIDEGDFVTVLGTNGAGKSTLFNTISGNLAATEGSIRIAGVDLTRKSPEKRAKFISRVFQDPKMGTAPRMSVAENLALATHRGERLMFQSRQVRQQMSRFKELAQKSGNGLDLALDKPTEQLSGGQRQALSLLMATIKLPELLLLDEHTAALDPHTSMAIMGLTNQIVTENKLTALMITHQLDDALKYGNRLIVLDQGLIVADYNQQEKNEITKQELLEYFG
ncbi:ABC transporter ATPase [Amylolactobacillus amylotrophicus DSM 20534]|uniref:ABC transporter ATP-binding protein n=3 Tax=Amylolactobacillus TaxID=2767876 RepID=A0A1L6XB22_9LACO|nr:MULTISPECIES: ATP-binding cassette domain-containing protein [Amylolactobacillus]APT18174.1 ABC transporter ATP-binding protein [Amylolactobacillus amylophilus DSM 20533 = JCM 1125]KRK37947.1 ABC transporter ATPase [Amylolactobacillus amylotrophicus DSM 20534]KRM42207.1 ABC transporter ATPase [Amylolactobacillus amylophilus DSM 20533 = JCM 1125]GED80239.1 phosphonate ABC transporter ATP-binding protein [Amylolactobacillus amylophilus]